MVRPQGLRLQPRSRWKTRAKPSTISPWPTAPTPPSSTFAGGSGKAHIQSPCTLTVADGKAVATVVWSSSKYDYMLVDGERYDVLTTEPGSTFEIPVAAFDTELTVIGDTTAMSTPA